MSGIAFFDEIPQEIWTNIFLECLPHDEQYMQPDSSSAPLLLCQVNRAWRSTALSLSALWSSISLEVSEGGDSEATAEGAGVWLQRSGTRPLAVSLCIRDVDEITTAQREPEVDMDPILDLLITFIERWEIVQFELAGPFYGSIANIHLFRAPLLKCFNVRLFFWTNEVVEPLFSMISTSPRLTDFVWHNEDRIVYKPLFHIAEPRIPWSQLTLFKAVHDLDISECLMVLRSSHNLLDCTFESIIKLDWNSPDPHDTPIVHQQLRTLSLSFQDEITAVFFDRITLPALSSLTLQSTVNDDDIEPCDRSVMTFFSRSRCTLKTFRVQTVMTTNESLIALLSLLPALTELSIEGDLADSLDDFLIRNLTFADDEGAECLCPKLQAITFAGHIKSSPGTLLKMLRSRYHSELFQPSFGRLQRFTVMLVGNFKDVWQEYWTKEVEVMRDEGLDVTMKWERPKIPKI